MRLRVAAAACHRGRMRSSDDSRIAFLLSLAALPLAACPSDDGDATESGADDSTGADDDGMTMSDPSASMTADDSGSSGPSTVADSSDGTGPDDTSGSAESGSSGATGDTGADSSTGGAGLCPDEPTIPQACTEFAAHFVKCDPDSAGDRPNIAEECACYLGYYAPSYSEGCATAVEDYYTCLVTADCKELLAETACADEGMAVDTECV